MLSLLSCWPDGYSRYFSIAQIIKTVCGNSSISILDVGGNSEWMHLFLKSAKVRAKLTVIDVLPQAFHDPDVKYIQSDFFTGKFEKADIVISTDVLEHIPEKLKEKFVDKALDLAQSFVILAAPQDDADITNYELAINRIFKKINGHDHRWLKEHFTQGKLQTDKVRKHLQVLHLPFIELDSNNIDNWFLTFFANLLNQQVTPLKNMDKINRFYNLNITEVGDYSLKAYRKVFIIFKEHSLKDKVESEISNIFTADTSKRAELMTMLTDSIADSVIEQGKAIKDYENVHEHTKKILSDKDERIRHLEHELNRIYRKFWFRYVNKIDSIFRRNS